MTFDVRTSALQVTLHSGVELTMSIGTDRTLVDRPVVYLDQNHRIDMARFGIGPTTLSDERRRTCRRITSLAVHDQILLPVSSAHLVEISKNPDRQVTGVRFLSDIQTDLASAVLAAGLTSEQFRDWCENQAEPDIPAAPMLGRFRELVHCESPTPTTSGQPTTSTTPCTCAVPARTPTSCSANAR
jgi:hypothetical protein